LRSCLDAGSPACYSGAARGAYAANQSKVDLVTGALRVWYSVYMTFSKRVTSPSPTTRVETEYQALPTYVEEAHAWDHQTVEVTRNVTTYPVNSRGVQWSKASKEAETFSIARADIPELIAALASYLADFTQTELEKA
jgi:hypothetical protein